MAKDSDLDLAWLQVVDTKGRTFKYIDFNDAKTLDIGDSYYTVTRMADRFDRVPIVRSDSIAASSSRSDDAQPATEASNKALLV